jgi:hypothetical protein
MGERLPFLLEDAMRKAVVRDLADIIDTIGDTRLRNTAGLALPESEESDDFDNDDELPW